MLKNNGPNIERPSNDFVPVTESVVNFLSLVPVC